MPRKTSAKNRIPPETVLAKVQEGHGGRRAFGSTTYEVLLDRLVAAGSIEPGKAHETLWEGAAARAKTVLAEVRRGRFYFPAAPRCKKTLGDELSDLAASGRVSFKDARAAAAAGNMKRSKFILDRVSLGYHEWPNRRGETYAQELARFVQLGFVSAHAAARATRAGYRLLAVCALGLAREGQGSMRLERGGTCAEELEHLVGLGYVEQEEAHVALFEGKAARQEGLRKEAHELLVSVHNGMLGLLPSVRDFVERGVLDEEDVSLAIMKGTEMLLEECTRRKERILFLVSNGPASRPAPSGLTVGEELQFLVDKKVLSQEDANHARYLGTINEKSWRRKE